MGRDHGPVGTIFAKCVCPELLILHLSNFYIQLSSVADLAEMVAIGLDLPHRTFNEAGKYGFIVFLYNIILDYLLICLMSI